MERKKLLQIQDYFGHSGISMTPDKALLLQNSLAILEKNGHFEKLYYWGQITGTDVDYHIAYGHKKDCLRSRLYFYSTNCIDWLILTAASKYDEILTHSVKNLFSGDPSTVSIVDLEKTLYYDCEEKCIKSVSASKYPLKEENRLAATIKIITDETLIIPRGAWVKQPNGDITENKIFPNFDFHDAMNLNSYVHAKFPFDQWIDLMDQDLKNYCINVRYGSVESNTGSWILQSPPGSDLIIIRNIMWPGMTFYYQVNEANYGWLYVGSGLKNFSIPFKF